MASTLLPREGEAPQACAERLAREKALDVFRQRPQDFVLGADTIVIVDSQILGKPHDVADAAPGLRDADVEVFERALREERGQIWRKIQF